MAASLLDDAIRYHVWATLRLIDVCAELCDDERYALFHQSRDEMHIAG